MLNHNLNFYVNPFLANVPILYPLKTPENQRFSGAFRGYKMGTMARNGLNFTLTIKSSSCGENISKVAPNAER